MSAAALIVKAAAAQQSGTGRSGEAAQQSGTGRSSEAAQQSGTGRSSEACCHSAFKFIIASITQLDGTHPMPSVGTILHVATLGQPYTAHIFISHSASQNQKE
eukprot:6472617-Amphidinium_carterae.2